MSNEIIPFDDMKNEGKLPAAIRALAENPDEGWSSGQSAGFPVLSIKGKVFRIKRGEDYELVTRPDDPDEAATSLQLSVIRGGPGVARTYYSTSYDEDSHEAPDCYSNDGVAPSADAENPQSKYCKTCPHSQWGSRVTENGKKGKACSEVKRLAVAAPGSENDPMLLRVPPTSLRKWDEYVAKLQRKGLNPSMVVTKVSFDPDTSHQLLVFRPVGYVNEGMAQSIKEMRDSSLVLDVIGTGANAGAPVADGPSGSEPKSEPKPDKTARKSESKAQAVAEPESESELEPEPKPKAKAEPVEEAASETESADEVTKSMDDMLGDLDLDFDD